MAILRVMDKQASVPNVPNKVIGIEVASFNDLVRMAASSMALGQATYILRHESGKGTVYGILAVFRDYYKFYGLPLFYGTLNYATHQIIDGFIYRRSFAFCL